MADKFLFPVGDVPKAQGFIPGQHYGIDFSVPVGTPVHAAADGKVTYMADETGGYGNIIELDHADGYQTRYAHLSQFKTTMGASVKSGDVIALSGGAANAAGAGNSKGPHLHFEIRQNGTPIDPAPLLAGTSNVASGTPGGGGSSSGFAGIVDFFTALTEKQTWIRVGEVVAGLGILYVSYLILKQEFTLGDLVQ